MMIDTNFKTCLWNQFGAAIDMLENAIKKCPIEEWNTETEFWYKAFHTIFFMDYYLSKDPDSFQPPSTFSMSEMDPSGRRPERIYTKEELLEYVNFCRTKAHKQLSELTDQIASQRFINSYRNYSILEIHIYNMRHVQHHAGQLYLLLRQTINDAPEWVSQSGIKLQ